jgi:LuxR family transcriptional regulator, maltose regulon positive regulatory protein
MPRVRRFAQCAVPKPPLAEIDRERLLNRLMGAGDERLIALVAPSGYGKTTLLTQFARAARDAVVWLSLTEEHVDVSVLHADVGTACAQVLGWRNREDSVAGLIRRLNAHHTNVNLVLDSINHLSEAGGQWLERLVEGFAEGNRALVSGYTEPPLRFSKLVTTGQALMITSEELAFTAEESRSYLNARGVQDRGQRWHEALEGWPAGLALAATGKTHLHPKRLVQEAIAQLSPAVRQALPEAAVLDVWNEAGATSAGCELPLHWLEEVRRSGLPLLPLGEDAFRPHLILRDALTDELRHRPERWQVLHHRAARTARAAGDSLTALRCYQASGALETALGLARELCAGYAKRLEYALIVRILEAFEAWQLDDELRALWGQALIQTGEVERGETILRALLESGRADSRTWFTLGLLASRRGRYEVQLEYARCGLRVPGEFDQDLRGLYISALHALDRTDEALAVARHLAAQAERSGNRFELALMLDAIQYMYDRFEQRAERRELIERAMVMFSELQMPARALRLQNQLADLLSLDGRSQEALRLIEQALPVAEREESRMQAFLLETRGETLAWLGEHARAATDFQLAERWARRFDIRAILPRLLYNRAVSLLHLRDGVNARLCLEAARLAAPSVDAEVLAFQAFAHGTHLWFEGSREASDREFARIPKNCAVPTLYVRAQAFRADIAVRDGAIHEAALSRFLEALDEYGQDDVLRADLGALRGLYETLFRRDPSSVRWRDLLESRPTVQIAATRVNLEIRTLGSGEVRINGDPLRTPSVRALEVLSYLALHGPSSRDRIVDALWSEESSVSAVNYFKVLIRRLRAALQTHPAIHFDPLPFNDNVYRIDERLEVTHDAAHLLSALRSEDADVREALALYRGAFLPEAESNWAETLRQRCLDELTVRALHAARTLEVIRPVEANALFESVIALDALSEPAYSGLIRTHLSLGRLESAQAAYTRLERMLATEFGATPSAELRRAVSGVILVSR